MKSASDIYAPARVGLLGEMAFGRLTGLETDLEYRTKGRDFDFMVSGVTFDIKTSFPKRKGGPGLILHRNSFGDTIPLKSDVYVFAHLVRENKAQNRAVINLVGFCSRKWVQENCRIEKGVSRAQVWHNWVIPFTQLRRMEALVDWVRKETRLHGEAVITDRC